MNASLVIVRHDFGGDGHTTHVPVRITGYRLGTPAYVTVCGRLAHVVATRDTGGDATCTTCQPRPGTLRDRAARTPDVPADQLARARRCACGRRVSTLPTSNGWQCAECD